MSSALCGCLKDIKSKNGALTEWNEVSRACHTTLFGIKLPQYLLESGLWRFIAAATDVNPSLRFREADYAWAVSERLPRASPEDIVFEAKKTDNAHDRRAPFAQSEIQTNQRWLCPHYFFTCLSDMHGYP